MQESRSEVKRVKRNLRAVGICGSPRQGGNTEILLEMCMNELKRLGFETSIIKLRSLKIAPCLSCRKCLETGNCVIDDDMTRKVIPKLLDSDAIVIASPVYFNNVSSHVKMFMDRTWCIRGKLKNKVGGAIVIGRGYGLESALTAIHSFMLKHYMIIGHRGVSAIGFDPSDVLNDERALRDTASLAKRIYELTKFCQFKQTP